MIDVAQYSTHKELFNFLVENKAQLIAQKKFEMKKADAFSAISFYTAGKDEACKASQDPAILLSKDAITAKIVINTTKLLDTHQDVHIDGLWKKTLKEQKGRYHLQEHKMQFDHVISDEVKAYTKSISWKDLGFEFEGNTEALMFDSIIQKVRNPFMFEQYAKGYVKNHSVGMQYIQLYLCINDDEYSEEKTNWDKYIEHVANKSDAEALGFFWAVTEAKLIEGSAVLMGSNWATPTQSVKCFEPSKDTQNLHNEPSEDTHKGILSSIGNKFKN